MIKWKYRYHQHDFVDKRGRAENIVKEFYAKKGYTVLDSSWNGYRLIASEHFLSVRLNEKQLVTKEQIFGCLKMACKDDNPLKHLENTCKLLNLIKLICVRRGLPDFMIVKTTESKIKFIEVKSSNDGISTDQMKVAEYLKSQGFSTTFFFVLFNSPKKQPKLSRLLKCKNDVKKHHPVFLTHSTEL
jgi:hypothetical protein